MPMKPLICVECLAPSERGYCDKSNQGDLVNQCPIWRDQVRKIDTLKQLSSEQN